MRLVSFITEPPVVKKILAHLERTGSDPARAPPRLESAPKLSSPEPHLAGDLPFRRARYPCAWSMLQSARSDPTAAAAERKRLRRQWAQLIRRIYEWDPLQCTCGAQMRVLSFITEPPVVRKILEHLHRIGCDPARAPPGLELEPEALVS